MPSTLPILIARRLADGTVELYQGENMFRRYLAWHPDRPSREQRNVIIGNKHYRLLWSPTEK